MSVGSITCVFLPYENSSSSTCQKRWRTYRLECGVTPTKFLPAFASFMVLFAHEMEWSFCLHFLCGQQDTSAPRTGCGRRPRSRSSPRMAALPGASRRCHASGAPPAQCSRQYSATVLVPLRCNHLGRVSPSNDVTDSGQATSYMLGSDRTDLTCAQAVGSKHQIVTASGSEDDCLPVGLGQCNPHTLSLGKPLSGSAIRLYAALSERLILPCGKFSLGMSVPAARRVPVVSDKAKSSQPAGEETTCRHVVLASGCLHCCNRQCSIQSAPPMSHMRMTPRSPAHWRWRHH